LRTAESTYTARCSLSLSPKHAPTVPRNRGSSSSLSLSLLTTHVPPRPAHAGKGTNKVWRRVCYRHNWVRNALAASLNRVPGVQAEMLAHRPLQSFAVSRQSSALWRRQRPIAAALSEALLFMAVVLCSLGPAVSLRVCSACVRLCVFVLARCVNTHRASSVSVAMRCHPRLALSCSHLPPKVRRPCAPRSQALSVQRSWRAVRQYELFCLR
jgi:hypothetical protein